MESRLSWGGIREIWEPRCVSRMTKIKWKIGGRWASEGGTFISNIDGIDRHKIHNGILRDTRASDRGTFSIDGRAWISRH